MTRTLAIPVHARHLVARTEVRLRALVGIRYRIGQPDDPPERLEGIERLDPDVLDDGIDCLELMVAAYAVIRAELVDDRYRFPLPPGYPYPEPMPSGAWIPPDEVEPWAAHFQPVAEGRARWADAVTFGEDHVGLLIGSPANPEGLEVLHCHRNHGTTLHPLARLARWSTGTYRLRVLA